MGTNLRGLVIAHVPNAVDFFEEIGAEIKAQVPTRVYLLTVARTHTHTHKLRHHGGMHTRQDNAL
jgi:hypothetical protein